jgi:4-hydroxybenzoate polyprenyltransferase
MENYIIEIMGWIATILILVAFYMNTRKIIPPNSVLFLGMNFISGLLMAVNSAYHHAYPSMTANTIWLLIAATSFFKNKNEISHD